MTPAARVASAITVLDDILDGRSAEQALAAWARGSRFAGSKDRAALRDLVFDALRCRSSCAALGGGLTGRGLMVGLGAQSDWDMAAIFSGEGHAAATLTDAESALLASQPRLAPHEVDDLPAWMQSLWYADLGDAAGAAAQVLRSRAPLFLRVNRRRGSVADAQVALAADQIDTTRHPFQDDCLAVTTNPRRVKLSDAFETGLVEVQDAASQIAVAGLDIPTGARVLDYCAGGGGKALAIADRFDCEVVAHDVAPARMQDIDARAKRAGVTIAQCETADLKAAGLFDVVVVDAPCSGSGTWRRNPEAKWALTAEKLHDFRTLQQDVLEKASSYVGENGHIVYMTCSVFAAENSEVVTGFVAANPGFQASAPLRLSPTADHDGFFCQRLSRSSGTR